MIDLTGKTFGDRTAIRAVPVRGRQMHWLARCICGQEDIVPSQRLRQEGGSSCRKCGRARVGKVRDLTGQQFGSWSVLKRAPKKGRSSGCSPKNRLTGVSGLQGSWMLMAVSQKLAKWFSTRNHMGVWIGW
jgi:hypothetical protein